MKRMLPGIRFFCLLSFLFFSTQQSFATLKRWVCSVRSISNYWSVASNWSPAGIPQPGDKIEFDPGYLNDVKLDIALPILSGIISNASTGLFATGAGRQIIISTPDTALYVNNNLEFSLDDSSYPLSISFSGSGNKAYVNAGCRFYIGQKATLNTTNSNFRIAGLLEMSSSSSAAASLIVSSASDLFMLAGSEYRNGLFNCPAPLATWDVNSTCTFWSEPSGGLTQAFGNVSFVQEHQAWIINLHGRMNNVRGNLTLASAYPGSSFIFGTDSTYSLSVGGNIIIKDTVTHNGAPPVRLVFTNGSANPVITVNGAFQKSLGNNFQVDFGAGTGYASVYVKGNFSHTGIYLVRTGTGNNGCLLFNGTTTQQLTIDSSDHIAFYVLGGSTVNLNTPGGIWVLNKSLTGSVAGSIAVTNGGTLLCNTQTIKSYPGTTGMVTSFALYAGGQLGIGSTDGVTTSGGGNIQLTSRSYSNDAIYNYTATTSQVTGLPPMMVRQLKITNSSYQVALSNPMQVSQNLYLFPQAKLVTNDTNMLTLNSGSTVINYGGMVCGPMRKVGNTAFQFPLGWTGSTNGPTPLSISAPAATTDTFTACYYRSSAAALGPVTAPGLASVSNCDYWSLAYSGTAMPTISLTGLDNATNSGCVNSNPATLALARFTSNPRTGSGWSMFGQSVVSGGSGIAVTYNNIPGTGYFALGNITSGARMMQNALSPATTTAALGVWPNPSNGEIHLGSGLGNDTNPAVYAKIHNTAGQLLQNINLRDKHEVIATLVQPGMYFVTLIDKDGRVKATRKIVVSK